MQLLLLAHRAQGWHRGHGLALARGDLLFRRRHRAVMLSDDSRASAQLACVADRRQHVVEETLQRVRKR